MIIIDDSLSQQIEKIVLESQIELLEQFKHVEAWTGTLGKLKQSSYILYSDVLKMLNQKKKELEKYNA